ncbi:MULTISPECIES: hypothetical protein [Cyanophyceae]|uniref:hypothetical protein n=1 Tax=Cyanophyceae TaxID=3028117 RepID=UPI00168960FA|nr:hypothetical protein [Trichocoleus sp. FACHB-40]MBD2002137.1 hypothetical protein [Trichocoleus sp. FACHB-40]
MLFRTINQAFVLQSGDRCYCIHQPETAIASLQRMLDKERSLFSLLMRRDAIAASVYVRSLDSILRIIWRTVYI